MDGCTNPMFLLVDNSDSPSAVEQLQQGCDSGCYTLLAVIPSSMRCLMPYACQLASCSMGISYYASCSGSYVLIFPMFFSSVTPTSSTGFINWGSAAPFYQGCFLIEPWESLSDFVHPGIACLAF